MNLVLILTSVLLNCAAQLMMKKGMTDMGTAEFSELLKILPQMLSSLWLWGAVFAYGISFILWLVVLAKTPVSVAFPFLSIGYAVVTVCGYFFFGEKISVLQICGLVAICAGVILISRS